MSDVEVRTARGAVSLYFASVFSLVLNTVYLIALTNLLPEHVVGVVALLNVLVIGIATVGAMAIPVIGAGLSATPPAVARFLSQYIKAGNGSASRRILLISTILCFALTFFLAVVLTRGSVESFLSVPSAATEYAALDGICFGLGQVGAYSLIGTENASKAGGMLIVSAVLRYAASTSLLVLGWGAAGIFQGFIVGDVFLAAGGIFLASRSIPNTGVARIERSVYPYMLYVLLAGLIGFAVSQSDRLLAFVQTGLGNLAVYNIAAVGASVAAFAPIAVTNALVPTLAFLGPKSERRLPLMRDYTRYVSLVAMPAGFGLAALSPILLLVFGEQYAQGGQLVLIMSIAIGLTAFNSVYSSSLLASGKTHLFLVANTVGLVALVALAYVLVPVTGLLGIALARAAMLGFTLLALAIFVRPTGDLVLDVPGYLKSLLSSVLMFVVVYGLVVVVDPHFVTRATHVLFSIALIPVGAVVYLVSMRLTDAFGEEDFAFVERLLPGFLRPANEWLKRLFLRKRNQDAVNA